MKKGTRAKIKKINKINEEEERKKLGENENNEQVIGIVSEY